MPQQAKPFKRLLAAIYDGFLVLAVLFIATAITLPFKVDQEATSSNIFMSLYLFSVIFLFFGWFWTHGGQTLGMRAWKLQLVQFDKTNVTWKQSFIRLLTGLPAWGLFLFGLLLWIVPDKIQLTELSKTIPEWLFVLTGLIWVWLDTLSNSWRDKLSGTQVIIAISKPET